MNKTITKLTAALTVIALCCSCGSQTGGVSEPAGATGTAAPLVTQAASETAADELPAGEPLTVYVPMNSYYESYTDYDYATKLAQDAGFNLKFVNYDQSLLSSGGGYDSFLNDFMNSDNAVYVTSQSFAYRIIQAGEAGDFYDAAAAYAPGYYSARAEEYNQKGSLTWAPVGHSVGITNPAVLIRNNVGQEYGEKITNAAEYEKLLRELLSEDPTTVPGVISFLNDDKMGNLGYMPFDLFLSAAGYTPLCSWFPGGSNLLWMNDATGEAAAFYDIPEARDALLSLLSSKRDGLIQIVQSDSAQAEKNPPTYLSYNGNVSINTDDLNQYATEIFPKPYLSYGSAFSYAAVARPGTDITEFLRFMEWMNDENNYEYMIYGVEGADYSQENGFITNSLISGYKDGRTLACFRDDVLESKIAPYYSSVFSQNAFAAEQDAPAPDFTLGWETRLSIGAALSGDAQYIDSLSKAYVIMADLFTKLYATDEEPADPDALITEAFDSIKSLPGLNLAENLVNQAMQNK